MTKRAAILFVLAAACGLLVASPGAWARSDAPGLLDPVQSLLPTALPSPGEVVNKTTSDATTKVGGAVGQQPDPSGAGGGEGESAVPTGSAPAGEQAADPNTSGAVTNDAGANAGDAALRPSLPRAPQWPIANDSQPIGSQLGTLASNAASLARPLAMPLAFGVVAVGALILATRRPHRLAKIESEGTWGNAASSWRL